MGVASALIQISLVDLVTRGVDGMVNRMKILSGATQETQRHFDKLMQMGKGAAIGGIVTRQIAKELQPAVRLASDLQGQMKGVQAELSGGGKSAAALRKELAQIKSTAFDVQGYTPYNSTQLVSQAKALVKAGAEVKAIIGPKGAIAASSALATYEEMDPTKAGEALIAIGTPFKIQADGYMKLADEISRASSASIVGAPELVETARYASPTMAALGKNYREMLVMSAMMAQRGLVGTTGGTAIKDFFLHAARYKIFQDSKGNPLETSKMAEIMRQKTAHMGLAQKTRVFERAFGDIGMPVALALLEKGKDSYEDISDNMTKSLGVQEKLTISMEGFGKKLTSLKGTSSSAIADLFQPALNPLGQLVDKANEFATAIGKAAQGSDTLSKVVTGTSFGALAVGTMATLGFGAGALYYGKKTLTGLGGIKGLFKAGAGLATNVAKGKALQEAAGVQSVFVVNMPDGGLGGPEGLPRVSGGGMPAWLPGFGAGAAALAGIPLSMAISDAAKANGWGSQTATGLERSVMGISGQAPPGGWLNPQTNVNLTVSVDRDGRVTATNSGNQNTQLSVNRGRF